MIKKIKVKYEITFKGKNLEDINDFFSPSDIETAMRRYLKNDQGFQRIYDIDELEIRCRRIKNNEYIK